MGQSKAIRCIYIMARTEDLTLIIEFDFQNKKVNKSMVPHGKEYKGLILQGWKEGILIEDPNFKLNEIVGI